MVHNLSISEIFGPVSHGIFATECTIDFVNFHKNRWLPSMFRVSGLKSPRKRSNEPANFVIVSLGAENSTTMTPTSTKHVVYREKPWPTISCALTDTATLV